MSNSTDQIEMAEAKPIRNMGFWTIWACGVGSVVGDGIFLLLGEGIAYSGPSAFLAFLIAGILQMFMMIGLGELAVGMPNAGAMSLWVERFMGKWWGFLSGFSFALGWVITGGTTGIALGRLTCWFFPSLDVNKWTIIFAFIFLSLFALLNILGTAIAARTQLILVIILISIMVMFGILGIGKVNMDYYKPFMPHGWNGFLATIPLGTYAYMGAVTLATTGSECKDPRHLPKAMVWASITFLAVYSIDQFVVEGIIPWHEVTMDVSPFTAAAVKIFGQAGGFILNFAAWIASATSILMGTIYASSRIFYQNAKNGYLPKVFAYINPKTRTPIGGILIVYLASIFLILIGIKNPDFVYVTLSYQMTFAWSLSWGLALVAAIIYHKKYPEEIKEAGWKQPLFPLFPILGILGVIMVVYFTFKNSIHSLLASLIWIGALAIYYKFMATKSIKKSLEDI